MAAKVTAPPGYCSHRSRPRPPKPRPTRDVTQASPALTNNYWGQPIPVGFGRRKVPGQIIWTSPVRVISGTRFCDMAISFGYSLVPASEIDEIKLISLYFNGKKVYSVLSSDTISTYADGALTTIGSASSRRNSTKPVMEIRWYAGKANQKPNKIIERYVGANNAVPYRNMLYCVVNNLNMDKFKLTEAPIVEALLADNYTNHDLYDNASSTSHPGVDAARIVWDSGTDLLHYFNADGSTIQTFDYSTLKQKATKTLKGSYAVGPDVIDHVLVADKETGLVALATGDTAQNENRAIHIVNPLTLKIGSGFYSGSSGDVTFTSTRAGAVDRLEFVHAAGTSTEGLFLAAAPDQDLAAASAKWLGILKVNASTGGLSYVWHHTFDKRVTGIFYSDEERLAGWGVLYVITEGDLYKVRINKDASSANSSGLVQLSFVKQYSASLTANGRSGIYDAASGKIIILYHTDDENIHVYDLLNDTNSFDIILTADIVPHERFFRGSDISGGSLFLQFDENEFINLNLPDIEESDLTLNQLIHVADTSATEQTATIANGAFWNSRRQAFVVPAIAGVAPACPGPGIVWPNFGYLTDGTGVALSNVFRWLLMYAGFDDGQIDVSNLPADDTSKILGGFWVNATNVWDEVKLIADAYNVDIINSDGLIKFVKKDRTSGLTTDADLSSDNFIPIDNTLVTRETRQNSKDLPQRVTVQYYDPDIGYALTSQHASRGTFPGRTTAATEPVDYTLPLVLNSARARTLAARILYQLWEEQTAIEFVLPRQYVYIEPGDIVGLAITFADGSVQEEVWKIRDTELTLDFQNKITATQLETEEDYEFPFEASAGIFSDPGIAGQTEAIPLAYDVPRPEKVSADNVEILAASVPKIKASWDGGNFYYEKNNDLIFQGFTSGAYQPLRLILESELTNGPTWTISEVSFDVSIYTGNATDLVSISANDLLEGKNLALVGNISDGYEYIQFRDVLDNSDGTYTLTGIIRGLRGTEYLTRTWEAGEEMVLVTRPNFLSVNATSELGDTVNIVAVGIGEAVDEGATAAVDVVGNSLKPYAPVFPYIYSGTWGSDMVIRFCPRNRGSYDLPENEAIASFPYDEDTVEFEVEIIDTDTTTVLRTFTALTSPEFTYTAVNQALDFASTPTPLYLRAYQISDNATIDRGYSNLLELNV